MRPKKRDPCTYDDLIENQGESEDFDEVLRSTKKLIPHQVFALLFIGLAIIFSAASSVEHIFSTTRVIPRCFLPECGDLEYSANNFDVEWLEDKIPLRPDGTPEGCITFEHLYEGTARCVFKDDYDGSFESCNRWVFNKTEKTIQNTFKIFCSEEEWKLELVSKIKLIATTISFLLLGLMADRYGRKKVLTIALISVRVIAMIKTGMPTYEPYLVFEVFESLANGGLYNIALILLTELVSSKRRYWFGICFAPVCKYFGFIMVTCIAMTLKHWQHTCWAINSPIVAVFVVFIWLLPESVRWLIVRGRLGDAKDQIFRLIGQQYLHVNKQLLRKIGNWYNGCVDQCEEDFADESLFTPILNACFSKKLVLRFLLCLVLSVVVNFVNFGLHENPPRLPDSMNDYWRNITLWLMDVPGFFVALLLNYYLSQPKSMGMMLFFCAFFNIANIYVPRANRGDYIYYTKLPLYIMGRITISGTFATLQLTMLELFPTKIRATVLGIFSAFGQIAFFAALYTPNWNKYHEVDMSLGLLAVVAAVVAVVFLPDSTEKPLPMTIAEAEKVGKLKGLIGLRVGDYKGFD